MSKSALMKNFIAFIILVSFSSCQKDTTPFGPSTQIKKGMVTITVSYPKTCENALDWGKISVSVAGTKADLASGSTLGNKSFITNADPTTEKFTSLLAYGTYYYKVSLLSYCNSQPNFEETGSFVIQLGTSPIINVTIK